MSPSLQKRLSAILGLVLTASGITSYLILKTVISPAFGTLESDVAKTDLIRAALGIDGQLQQITAITGDWAPWDQINDYALGKDPESVFRNIDESTLQNLDVDVLQIFDLDDQRLWVGFVQQGQYAEIATLGRFGDDDPVTATLTSHARPDSVVAGMLMTRHGPMVLVSMPLVDEAAIGPINGAIMMGRILTEARLQNLRDHIKVNFDILPMSEVGIAFPGVLQQFEGEPGDTTVQRVEDSAVHTYRMLTDIGGDPVGVLHTRTGREVSSLGNNAADVALLLFVITSVLMLGFLWFLLRMDIVRPLARLASHMADIRRSGELSARLTPTRNDEVGRLAMEFNGLTGELQQARRQLVDQSFNAGRADTAAEVLHNIRNAMTPVVDVAENLSGALDEISSLRFRQAADELADSGCDEQRRIGLLRYLIAAADRTKELGSRAVADVDLICQQTRLVEEILAGQEKVTRAAPFRQHLNLADVVREACNVLPRNAGREIELRIAPELADLAIIGIRVQILQIFGNVVLNAYEAIQRTAGKSGCIEIFAAQKNIKNVEMVELSIRDTGVGLEQNTLTRIFQRGFTSKKGAGSGLGLHWCANAVGVFGGSIRAESPGPGKGTTVHMVLPAVGSDQTGAGVDNERMPSSMPA
jgi:two-component system, NtrC family, sensor kinase